MKRFTRVPATSGANVGTMVLPRQSQGKMAGAEQSGPRSARLPQQDRSHLRAAKRYAIAALGCALFAFIYAQFSHGVYSPFMTFMFTIPLVGGAAVALGLHFAHVRELPRAARQAWALALASLTIASCLRGVFDIAGTASPLLVGYLAAAAVFAIVAAFFVIRSRRR